MHSERSLPSMIKTVKFKTGYFRTIGRFFIWGLASVYYFGGVGWYKLIRRATPERQAKRLRKTFEWIGGTTVKIGQQLSSRIDLLPYVYCHELSKLLDQQPSFPVQKAIRRIEASTGQQLDTIFSSFNTDPIGAASIACVYNAQLKDGTQVAVKVRRPGIGELFMADLAALDFICFFLEFFTLLRPGITKSFRSGLRSALLEEMDFRKEARYQRLFRESMKKAGVSYIKAPKVIHKLSGEDVLVMKFVSGTMLSKVLDIVAQKDEKGIAFLKANNIKPKKLARRMLWVSHMAMVSELFFHSDPSPSNIIVQKDSTLVFIDFGSCGTFNHSQKRFLKEINHYQFMGDAEGMARATIGLLQPLPYIDIDKFSNDIEKIYLTSIFAMADKKAEWWERTTAKHWFDFMRIAMRYRISLPEGLIHMIRATMLYDTISARLDKNIVFYDQYRKYEKYAGKLARKRLHKQVSQLLTGKVDPNYYLKYEQMLDTGNRLFFRFQRLLEINPLRFSHVVGKGYFLVGLLIRLGVFLSVVVMVILLGSMSLDSGKDFQLWESMRRLLNNRWFQGFLLLSIFLTIRRVLFRIDDRDV